NYLVGQVDQRLTATSPGIAHAITDAAQGVNLSTASCARPDPRNGPRTYDFEVSNSTGTLDCAPTDGSGRGHPDFPHWSPQQAGHTGGQPFPIGSTNARQQWRTVAFVDPDSSTLVYIATSLDAVEHTLGQLLLIEIVGGLAVVVLLGAVGYVV